MSDLSIDVFGDFQVYQDGQLVELPPSKKARALLAYLMLSDRPVRREQLCELFWETPDDPKGALRWALSRLRRSFSETASERLVADRERVSFDMSGAHLQSDQITKLLARNSRTKEDYFDAIALLDGTFLAGLDMPNLESFTLWLSGQRQKMNLFKGKLIEVALQACALFPDEEVSLSQAWVEAEPFNQAAAQSYLSVLHRQQKGADASAWTRTFQDRFRQAGLEFIPPVFDHVKSEADSVSVKNDRIEPDPVARQKIQFCQTPDGVNLAYASVGSGPPLVKAANWLTHLELDWSAPIWSPLYRDLAKDFTFIRYDERGNGLSDWDVDELSQKTFVDDLACVVDHMGLETFPLLGISQGAAVSIEYAIRHPKRVSKLILFGGYPKGWRIDGNAETVAEREAIMTLTKTGWGQNNPAYRHIFSSTFMPGATAEQLAWFNDFQRQTTSPENAVKFLEAFSKIDVREQLSRISVPTLVLHSRGDQRIDWQVGRDIAAAIPDAEFVTLDSENHLLLEGETAATKFVSAIREFLS